MLYQMMITLLLLVILANVLNNLRLLHRMPREGPLPHPLPLVSVLIPARDEERNILRCLKSLLRQDYPRLEILVLDDESSDRTAEIVTRLAAEHPQIRLFHGRPLPPGWHGKAYACHQLAQAAQGEWLLFTDADTVHAPHAVSSALRAALQSQADLVSLFPRTVMNTLGEAVALPLITVAPMCYLPLGLINRTRHPLLALAIGPFMFFRRDFYRRIGGHEAVRRDITEDVFLARLVKQNGGRVALMDGTHTVSVRFYRGLREAWRGFSKSAFPAFDYELEPLLALLLVNIAVFLAPLGFLLVGLLHGWMDRFWVGLPLLQLAIALFIRFLLARRFEHQWWTVLLHPLMIVFGALVALNSVHWARSGLGIAWKGRSYHFAWGKHAWHDGSEQHGCS